MRDPFANSPVRRVTLENLHEFKPYLKGKQQNMATKTIDQSKDIAYLTPDELTVVRAAIRGSLDLRTRYVKLFTEDKKMKSKQRRFTNKEIPLLKSALAKLK